MNKLILIDGYSFLFRAFFAIRNLTRNDGTPVGGLYGFSRMLMKIITEIEYTHIAVVFDTGEKTFRNDMYSEYKANRPPCPKDLIPQFPLVREIVNVLNIVTLEKVGYEADDIIATYSKKAEKQGFEVMIVSSDKDLMQLIDNKINMFDGMKNEIIDTTKVEGKWGVSPKKLLDVLSLMGDSSDNVPGVLGIGPKTAAELINKYGNLESLYENLNDIKQEKRRQSLIDNKNNAFLSKKLITLDENVSMEYTLDDLKFKQYDYRILLNFLKKQEFNSMVGGLEKAFGTIDNSLLEASLESFKQKDENKNEIINLKDFSNLKEILKKITDGKKLYFNILTEKISYDFNIISFTFSGTDNQTYFIEISNTASDLFSIDDKGSKSKDVFKYFKDIFENNSVLKIGYDLKKQIKILNKLDIELNFFEDIEVINYILNTGLYDSLLSTIIINNLTDDKIDNKIELLKNIEKEHKYDEIKNNLQEISYFIIKSVKFLYSNLKIKILEDNELLSVYENIEKPMTKILADMEIEGIKIDIKRLQKLSNEFEKSANDLSEEIFLIAGQKFNIGSPKQLGEILFDTMKLKSIKRASKTRNHSTGAEVLEELASQGCEICEKILAWRHFTKLRNTYTDVLPKMVDLKSRIHTTYSNTNVISGRLSSNNPNLQNIPIKTQEGSKIRSAFIAKENCKLVSADYKQAELRIIANYKNVEKLKEFFLAGKDIHKTTASRVFKISEDSVTPEMRSIAKAINFSIIYGTGPYGLAKRTKTTGDEAKEYLKNYFETYPEIKNYIDETKDFVNKHNYVKTMFGRKININIQNSKPMIKSMLERLAINAPIQGTASDIIKKAMINLKKELEDYKSKIILQIHDELVLECPNEEVEKVSKILKDTMENVVDWNLKLEVDVEISDNLEK